VVNSAAFHSTNHKLLQRQNFFLLNLIASVKNSDFLYSAISFATTWPLNVSLISWRETNGR